MFAQQLTVEIVVHHRVPTDKQEDLASFLFEFCLLADELELAAAVRIRPFVFILKKERTRIFLDIDRFGFAGSLF